MQCMLQQTMTTTTGTFLRRNATETDSKYLLWAGSGFIEHTQSSGNTLPMLFEENGRILHLRHKSKTHQIHTHIFIVLAATQLIQDYNTLAVPLVHNQIQAVDKHLKISKIYRPWWISELTALQRYWDLHRSFTDEFLVLRWRIAPVGINVSKILP